MFNKIIQFLGGMAFVGIIFFLIASVGYVISDSAKQTAEAKHCREYLEGVPVSNRSGTITCFSKSAVIKEFK